MKLKSILLIVLIVLSVVTVGGVFLKKKMMLPTQDQNWQFNNEWNSKPAPVEKQAEPKVEPKKTEPEKKVGPIRKLFQSCPNGDCPNN